MRRPTVSPPSLARVLLIASASALLVASANAQTSSGFLVTAQARTVHAQLDREMETWPGAGDLCVLDSTPIIIASATAPDFEPFDELAEVGPPLFAQQSSALSSILIAGSGEHLTYSSHVSYGACASTEYSSDSSSSFSATFALSEPRDVHLSAALHAFAYNVTWGVANATSFVRLREEGGAVLAERTTVLPPAPTSCWTSTPCNGNATCEAPCGVTDARGLLADLTLPAGTYVIEAGTTGSANAPGDITFMLYDEGRSSGQFSFELELLCSGSPCVPDGLPALSGPALVAQWLLLASSGAWLALRPGSLEGG